MIIDGVYNIYAHSDAVFELESFIRHNKEQLTNEQRKELNKILAKIDKEVLEYEIEAIEKGRENKILTDIRWHKEDLEVGLKDRGYDSSPENVQKLLDFGVVNALQNTLTEYGNEVIGDVIDNIEGLERS